MRLRVIGDKLAGEIGAQVKKSVQQSAPALAEAGESVGEKVSDSAGQKISESVNGQMGRVADEIGDAIGRRMAENMGKSLRRRAGASISNGIDSARGQLNRMGSRFQPVFDRIGQQWGKATSGGMAKVLKGGIAAVIGFAITALPSMLAWAGAVAGALVATVIPAITAIAPAAAGAAVGAVAAFSAIKISAGLIGLAMDVQTAALEDMQKRFEDFKGTIAAPIQEGLIPHLNASMRLLGPLVSSIQPQLQGLGSTVGDLASDFAEAVSQGAMMDRIGRILESNNAFVRDAGTGVSGLGQAFIILLDHLRPVTEEIGSMVGQAGQWILTTVQAASASGALSAWIDRMWTAFLRLAGVVVDFGIGIYNVFAASQPAAQGMFTTLENTARKFREWTGDTANQDRMTTFFANMRRITGEVLSILKDIGAAGLGGLENTNVDSVIGGLDTLRSLGPPLAQMFNSIREAAGPQLADAFQSFADIVTQLADSGVVGVLSEAFANLLAAISGLLAIPGVGTLLAWVAGLAVLGKTISLVLSVVGFLTTALRPILGIFRILSWAVGILVGAFGIVPVIIGAVVIALVWFFTQTKVGQAIIEAVWNAIVTAFQWAVGMIQTALSAIWTALQAAWTFVQTVATGIWSAISTAFNAVVGVVSTALAAVWGVITTIWSAIWGFIQPILQGIWNYIQEVFNGIVTAIQFALNIILTIWNYIWPILALPIRILYGVIILIFTAVWTFIQFIFNQILTFATWVWNGLVSAITIALNAVWGFIQFIWNAIWGFLQPIIAAIVGFVVDRWNNLVHNVQAALSAVWGVIQSVWNAIWGFIKPIIQSIVGFVVDRWNNLVSNVKTAMNAIWGVIKSIWGTISGFIGDTMDTISGLISGAWDFMTGVGEGVLSGLKAAVNVVIDAINTVISGINWAIDTANQLPGPDIPTIPKIPRLARGGVVSPAGGGTLAMIAEAGRPERVEPLDPSGLSARDRALIDRLAGSGGAPNVIVYLGTRQIEDIVDVVVEDKQTDLAHRVLTGTKG